MNGTISTVFQATRRPHAALCMGPAPPGRSGSGWRWIRMYLKGPWVRGAPGWFGRPELRPMQGGRPAGGELTGTLVLTPIPGVCLRKTLLSLARSPGSCGTSQQKLLGVPRLRGNGARGSREVPGSHGVSFPSCLGPARPMVGADGLADWPAFPGRPTWTLNVCVGSLPPGQKPTGASLLSEAGPGLSRRGFPNPGIFDRAVGGRAPSP